MSLRKLLVFVLLLYGSQAGAERVSRAEFMVLCENHSALAATIMQQRQAGVSMNAVMPLAKGDRSAEKMVQAAFRSKQRETDKARAQAASDFENAVYAGCMNGAPRR